MRKLLKENLKIIIIVTITTIVATTTTIFAYSLIASEVGFTPHDNNWNVQDVDAALNNLNLRTNQLSTHYLNEEQVVGRWLDGKPIYQNTLTGTTPTSAFSIYEIDVSSLKIDTLVTEYVMYDVGNHNFFAEQTHTSSYILWSQLTNNGTTFQIRTDGRGFTGLTYYATLQYTKTTD